MSARMEAASRLIHRARSAGGSLAIHGGKLKALSVPAELLPELLAFKPEIVRLLTPTAEGVGTTDTMPAPTTEGMRAFRTPQPAPNPITRPVLRFKLREGGGTVLGQPDDTPASLLAVLIDKWPDELVAVWSGTDQVWP
ncbi:MAG: hypothetical protein PHT38_09810 [Halothiobacillus sp.]|nr:hypothetical protein [Halothiobacillus sp.]